MTAPTGTDPLEILREVDPARAPDDPGAGWVVRTRREIIEGDRRGSAPRARQWAGVVAAGAGVAAIVALMAVLLVAGGGDDGTADGGAAVASLQVVGAPATRGTLEDAARVVRARADMLGLEGVTVTVDGSAEAILVEGDLLEPDLEALASPGVLKIRQPGGSGVLALDRRDVARARADGDALVLTFTDQGAQAFTRLTRHIAQDGALMARSQTMEVVVDGVVLTEAVIDYEAYPTGIDGRQGLVVPAGTTEDARRLAAVLSTPLALGAAELRYSAVPVDPPARGTLTILVRDDATPATVDRMGEELRGLIASGDAATVTFVSEAEALERLRARLQDPSVLDELPANPMPATYVVVPAPGADPDGLVARIQALPGVESVNVAR